MKQIFSDKKSRIMVIVTVAVIVGSFTITLLFGKDAPAGSESNTTVNLSGLSVHVPDIDELFSSGADSTAEKAEKNTANEKKTNKSGKGEKTTKKKLTYKSGTLASGMDLSVAGGMSQSKSSVKFQSLYDFAKGSGLKFKEPSVHDNDTMQSFTGDLDDALYIAEYCERLAEECANFSMKERYYKKYDGGYGEIFASWGINYTGSASVAKSAEQNFVDGSPNCAISVYYMSEYNSIKGIITWSNDLDSTDLGMRCGGYLVDVTPGGKSSGAGLKGTSDGRYTTSDGRLSAFIGKSSLYINGTKQNGSAVFEDTKYSDAVKIKNSSGSEIIKVFFPEGYVPKTGDVFYTDDMLTNYQWSTKGESPSALNVDELRVYQKVNGSWVTPTYNSSPYNEALFRVMYYNASEGVAVFYLYTDTGTKTEMLCAVNLGNKVDYSGGSSGGSSNIGSSGSGKCRHCQGNGYKDCPNCVDGYYTAKIVTPNYAGSNNHHGTQTVKRPCVSYNCRGGRKDCPFC